MFSLLVGREDKGTLAVFRLTQFRGCAGLPCAVALLGPPAQDQGQLLPRWHELLNPLAPSRKFCPQVDALNLVTDQRHQEGKRLNCIHSDRLILLEIFW